MKQAFRRFVPKQIWRGLSRTKGRILDGIDRVRGKHQPLLPPRHLRFVGSGDFERHGALFLDSFIKLGGLEPEHRVLDIGSGIGRMAIPLTRYLSAQGSYEGVDIVREGVDWCTRNVSTKFPHFRFSLADILNNEYRADGAISGSEYRFEFPDAEFDFVFLTSVFTHLLPPDARNYLSEISRLLKPEGRCFATWFLLNEESEGLCRAGGARREFRHSLGDCLIANPRIPEEAIAYRESVVKDWYQQFSIDKELRIHYGSWCGRDNCLSHQDICVSAKRG